MRQLEEAVVATLTEMSASLREQSLAAVAARQPDQALELVIQAQAMEAAIGVVRTSARRLRET